ncbi:alpha/beta hydrolase family protein [Gordonia sp. VNK21]|uniref:alpha/beta hydrolase family protein n=1 Tax=Gordonia sp. VNK21 TaxID=3382483 RepID=UPI0038D4F9BD
MSNLMSACTTRMVWRLGVSVLSACVLIAATGSDANAERWSPALEASTVALAVGDGGALVADPSAIAGVAQQTAAYQRKRADALQRDRERQPNPNSCTVQYLCPMNPEYSVSSWKRKGGLVEPVLYTSRSGATISGHVWAMERQGDPAQKPGIVITNGSIVEYEQAYWYLAQHLAAAGYIVMTHDAQGEGMSDQFGQHPDELEDAFAGIPVLGLVGPQRTPNLLTSLGGNGLPFYDGQIDALDFFLSAPDDAYKPRRSRTTRTDHSVKQNRRVASGLNAGYNPFWKKLDRRRIGLAGHSYGAVASSWNAQNDHRVSAAVAIDSQCVPPTERMDEMEAFFGARAARAIGPVPLPAVYGFNKYCFGSPAVKAPRLRTPVLGLSGDYLLLPVPRVQAPDPLAKSEASFAFSRAGVDTADVVIRGAYHLDFSDSGGVLPGTADVRGITNFYTTAWFDKYLKGDQSAVDRLAGERWRHSAHAPAPGEENRFSAHYRSRIDVTLGDGERLVCEDVRRRCDVGE